MEIKITERAQEELRRIRPGQDVLRISGELVGGCGMNVAYFLYWDDDQTADPLVTVDGLRLVVDEETSTFLDSASLTIEYLPHQGFRLITPAQIVAYGLRPKPRWS